MATYKIGSFSFIDMSPYPAGSRQNVQVEARNGVAGHALFWTGKRGRPIQVQTVVDATNGATGAATIFESYLAAVGESALVVWAGIALPKPFDILDVSPIRVEKISLGVGGLNGTSTGIVRANWVLQATET